MNGVTEGKRVGLGGRERTGEFSENPGNHHSLLESCFKLPGGWFWG